jgi:hypothetical protein
MAITLLPAGADALPSIHAHLAAGHQVAIVTYGHATKLTAKHIDYIHAAEGGYRLGWPGKKSVFAFAYSVFFVPAGYSI